MFAELHAATSSRRERLDEAAGTTPEEPEEEQPPVQGEPLTVRERFAFSTFEKVWTKRMGVLDEEGLPMAILMRLPKVTLWLIWEILKSNMGVVRVILNPKLARPQMVSVKAMGHRVHH